MQKHRDESSDFLGQSGRRLNLRIRLEGNIRTKLGFQSDKEEVQRYLWLWDESVLFSNTWQQRTKQLNQAANSIHEIDM